MWLAKLQMEVFRFPEGGVKMVAKVVNPSYAEVIQRKLLEQGIEAEVGKSLDITNDISLRWLSEGTRKFFREEQLKRRLGWSRVLRDNLEKWIAAGRLQDEEEVRQHYQPLFPSKVWPYFEELVVQTYHYICSRMNPEMIAKEFMQDFYDLTEGACLRICRSYDEKTHLLVEQALREAEPTHDFCWIDCKGVQTSDAEMALRQHVLPSKGQDEKENEFYDHLSRWLNRYRNHYPDPKDLDLVFHHYIKEMQLAPNLEETAAMIWRRYAVAREMKKQQLHIQHLQCSSLKTMLEVYFHWQVAGVEPEDYGYRVPARKESAAKIKAEPAEAAEANSPQEMNETKESKETKEADGTNEIPKMPDLNGAQKQRIATMAENDAWLRAQKEQEEDVSPKYYAVAKGKICGIFTDPELYEKALGWKETSISEVFPSYKAAKKWLRRQREEAEQKKKTADKKVKNDFHIKDDMAELKKLVKAAVPAKQAETPAKSGPKSQAARSASPIKDSRAYLLQILKSMPLENQAGQGNSSAETFAEEKLAGVRQETADFLAYANEQKVDIIGRLQFFTEQQSKKIRTPKQMTNALLHHEMIPSSYKLLLQDIFSHMPKKAASKGKDGKSSHYLNRLNYMNQVNGGKNKQAKKESSEEKSDLSAAQSESQAEAAAQSQPVFEDVLAGDRAYFAAGQTEGRNPERPLTEADAMLAYTTIIHCPLQTPADTYLFAASAALLFAYSCQEQMKPAYLSQPLGRLKQAKAIEADPAIYTYAKNFLYLVVYGLRFRIGEAPTEAADSPLAALLQQGAEVDTCQEPLAAWQRALKCQQDCGRAEVTEKIEADLKRLAAAMTREQASLMEDGVVYHWGPDTEAEVRTNKLLVYLLREESAEKECARFRCREDAENIRAFLQYVLPLRPFVVVKQGEDSGENPAAPEEEEEEKEKLPAYGVYDVSKKMYFLLATAHTQKLAEQIAAIFHPLKNRKYKVVPLKDERESEIAAYQGVVPDSILHLTGFLDPQKTLYEEIYDFLYEEGSAVYTKTLFEKYYALFPVKCKKNVRGEIRSFLFHIFKRVRYAADYAVPEDASRLLEEPKWQETAMRVFLGVEAGEPKSAAEVPVAEDKAEQPEQPKSAESDQNDESQEALQSGLESPAAAAIPAEEKDKNKEQGEQEEQQAQLEENDTAVSDAASAQTKKSATDANDATDAKAAVRPRVPAAHPVHQEHVGFFRGIQFDKHLFRNVPAAYQERFRRTFARRLAKMQTIFSGERRAAGNDFKMVAGAHGKRVFKMRIGDHRLSMVYKDGILTLLALSSHDRQMTDIRKIRGKSIGYVYYDTADFLHQLDAWQEKGERKHISLGDYLATPAHFVFDEDQQAIIESTEKAENLSVIGNAGAGKSVVGLKWLREELKEPDHDVLYLTMSENLVYTLDYLFEKEQLEQGEKLPSKAEIRTTFDFLRAEVKAAYPQIPEKKLLNAAQSFAAFADFWTAEVDWTQFWNHKDKDFQNQTEEMTRLSAWREIHGIIKGAVPEDVDYHRLDKIRANLSESEYQKRLQQEKKASRSTVLWETTLYRVYEKYQAYLRRQGLYDDNDMARLLLRKKRKHAKKYGAVFVDECQDLTQMELLAIFHLLDGTSRKRMASDRCQMVQPTYFDEGWMRTASNDYDRAHGRKIEDIGLRPRFLHYNYRSSRSIIEFQNYLVQHFRKGGLLTLRQDELREIAVPPLTPKGMKPVWVMASDKNREHLINDLWRKVPASDLQTIFAFAGSKGKKDFPLTAEDAVTDIIHCKGMEYPSVLLYNILSETRDNPALAWKYFYVGATRGNACLIIYEEAAKPGTKLYEFLEDAAIEGLIDYADDLLGKADYGEMTWLGYLYQSIHENTDENRMETAENALNFGQYDLALSIYAAEGKDKNMIAYCRGRVKESHGDYQAALQSYMALAPDWSNRGRTRQNAAETILTRPDVAGTEFLAAFCLTGKGMQDFVGQAKKAWQYKYGESKSSHFYDALFEALSDYPFLARAFAKWTWQKEAGIEKAGEAIAAAADLWPLG